ncbi:MAG: tRNA modification GTPase mnmE [Gemmatimonadetes bacterium]|nr:tRNA modification GTPase mnmE [Gemmatimonadota bacterium]
MSRRYLGAADLVLLCVETGWELEPEERRILAERPALLVWTKEDLRGDRPAGHPEAGSVTVSALTGTGLERLRSTVAERLFGDGKGGYADLEPMLTRERHRIALGRAREALRAAAPHLMPGGDAVLAAHHVRHAVLALDELVGAIDAEEIFDRIFSRFCVGK